MAGQKILPPTYLFISIVLMVLLHFLFPVFEIIPYPWLLLGSVPLSLGVALNLIADRAFKIFNTTVKPFEESAALITTGVFRISRHPMYLGMILMIFGLAILMASLTPFFVVPVFAALLDKKFIKVEERMLEKTFGHAWLEYKLKIRKWI